MPEQDDRLRELVREAREPDREAAPSFGATWSAAAERGGSLRRYVWGGVALAAAAAAVVVLWPNPTAPPPPDGQGELARTNPRPDVPARGEEEDRQVPIDVDVEEDATELEVGLAEWSPDDTFDTPSDFLLESDGALAGGIPSADWQEPVLGIDEFETTEL